MKISSKLTEDFARHKVASWNHGIFPTKYESRAEDADGERGEGEASGEQLHTFIHKKSWEFIVYVLC